MKKVLSVFVLSCISLLGFGQAIVDNAVIPVSVSLNSIMRMNVVSGGAIEFNVATLSQFENGISNTTRYTTVFTVASSVNFKVTMSTEDATFIGADGGTLDLDYVGYTINMAAGASGVIGAAGTAANYTVIQNDYTQGGSADLTPLRQAATDLITSLPKADGADPELGGSGDGTQNKFEIQWELGTAALNTITSNNTLANSSISPDRYTTNVFLTLTKL